MLFGAITPGNVLKFAYWEFSGCDCKCWFGSFFPCAEQWSTESLRNAWWCQNSRLPQVAHRLPWPTSSGVRLNTHWAFLPLSLPICSGLRLNNHQAFLLPLSWLAFQLCSFALVSIQQVDGKVISPLSSVPCASLCVPLLFPKDKKNCCPTCERHSFMSWLMGDSLVHWKNKFCYGLNLTTSRPQLLACASCFFHAPSCHSMKCPVVANGILGSYPINKDTHLHSWLPWVIMYNSHNLFITNSLLSQSWQWQGLVYKCFIFSDLMKAKKAKKAKKLSNQICNKTTYQEWLLGHS